MASYHLTSLVGGAYILIGVVGFVCNVATVLMIAINRVYRLSPYTIIANIAVTDAIMMLVAGVVCGSLIVWPSIHRLQRNVKVDTAFGMSIFIENTSTGTTSLPVSKMQPLLALERQRLLPTEDDLEVELHGLEKSSSFSYPDDYAPTSTLMLAISLLEIAAWTAGVVSYAYLGFNRCVAICLYGTKAKSLNRVLVALFASLVTWAFGIVTACVGTIPDPLMGIRKDMWTISFLRTAGARAATFITIASLFILVGVVAQWLCSADALIRIREVRKKINKKKLNVNSANRFREQARLTFQFIYLSILCTITSIVNLVKPFMIGSLAEWQFVLLHAVWLCNHMCNPFIYAYFNERMRLSYRNFLTCAPLRCIIRRKQHGATDRNRLNASTRSFGTGTRRSRLSTRSFKTTRDGNFVRSSLQMQSRNFEQLCEFMMRVNPLCDSSEGWHESSDEEEQQSATEACPTWTNDRFNQESNHLVHEAKKASA